MSVAGIVLVSLLWSAPVQGTGRKGGRICGQRPRKICVKHAVEVHFREKLSSKHSVRNPNNEPGSRENFDGSNSKPCRSEP